MTTKLPKCDLRKGNCDYQTEENECEAERPCVHKRTGMEAKDTVISAIEQTKALDKVPFADLRSQVCRDILCEAQAEISFKAGIKEVVKWIQFRNYSTPEHYSHFQISKYEWQAELKELGL